jgi:hypothetical protein
LFRNNGDPVSGRQGPIAQCPAAHDPQVMWIQTSAGVATSSAPGYADARGLSSRSLEWPLRLGACLCFVGHGAFGIIGKEAWVRYFAVVGIGSDAAHQLMPFVGTGDILLGALALARPRPALLAYMSLWAVWTALLRPLSGESSWEALERAGNYGVPIALLLLTWPRGWREWTSPAVRRPLDALVVRQLRFSLTLTTALLLVGHGALGVLGKQELVSHYSLVGLPWSGRALSAAIGWTEIGLASALLWHQSVWFCLALFCWKLATESLYLPAGAPVWEVVERGGSYAAPLTLAILLLTVSARTSAPTGPRGERERT